jgi:putative FmdB family regulatory protein
MPVYEYKCEDCGEKFEVTRGFFEKEKPSKCPKCGSGKVQKVYSLAGRGSGEGRIHFG